MAAQLQMLGLPRLMVDGRSVGIFWPRRALHLLTYLYTSRGAVPRDTAAFALWPDDDEEAARANLRRNLNGLRTALPAEVAAWIVTDPGSLEFRHSAADTDVAAFEARLCQPDGLRGAVELYGGDFAQPLDEPWVLTERERLRARFHSALIELTGIEFSNRRFDEALRYARRIFADEPFREDIARRIIAIRYAMGDRPGALSEFDRFARSLRAEMNIDPMPETVGLRDLVLRGEPLPFAPDAAFAVPVTLAAAPGRPLLPFTGRAAVLERLRSAWEAAAGGDGNTIFIAGEAGIGKSRIVGEFLERVVGTSARILRGTTASPEARPYEALLGALAQAAPFVPALNLEPVWLGALAPHVPEIAQRCAALPPQPPLPADREVTRLFEAAARFVAALARGRPVAIVLEDLHWSGAGTLEAIRRLAARLRGHRILLVATYRSGERPAVEATIRALCDSGHAGALALARLSLEETVGLLEHVEPSLEPAAAGELARRSAGHPLFLTELLRDAAAREAAGGGIGEVVGARLGRSSSDAQALARIAAVCGATFDLDLLQRVSGWDDGALIDGIAELLAQQFIRSTAVHERGSYAFSHALVHGAIEATMPGVEQRRTHRIVARNLEARESGPMYDAEIARHWSAAGESQRAAEAFLRAANASRAAHAREEAADLAATGLALTSDAATRVALLRCRIAANLRRVPAADVRPDVLALQAACRDLDADARFDAALLAYRVEEFGGSVESRDAAADALRASVSDAEFDPLRWAQIAEVGAASAMLRGRFRAALERARTARAGYATAARPRDELRLALLIANAHTRLGEFEPALAELVDVESRIEALDDLALTLDYWKERTSIPHAQRESVATLEAAQRLEHFARAAGDRLMEGTAILMAASAHQHASALTRTLRELDRAEEIYRSIGASVTLWSARNNRASVLFQIGRVAESAALLGDLYAEAKASGAIETLYYAASNLGCAMLAAGDLAGAMRLGQEALDLARQMGSERHAALALGDLGEAEAAAGRIESGLERLLEAADINARLGRRAVVAHDLARAAYHEPNSGRSGAHARAALAIVEADASDIALAPEVLARCAHAFTRAGEASAAGYCSRRGREILEARLAAVEGEDRDSYRAIAWHRRLLDADGEQARRVARAP